MRWTRQRARRTRPEADGEVVSFWHPDAGVKLAEATPLTTVSIKRGHRGEHEVSRKTIARGMPGVSGVTVVTMLVCLFFLHTRLRAHWPPGIPCALCNRRTGNSGKTRAQSRGEIARPYLYAAGCLQCEVGKRAPPSLLA